MEVPRIALLRSSNDYNRRYKQSRNIYMAVSSVNGPQIQFHYRKLMDNKLFPAISNHMNASSINFGLVKNADTIINEHGYVTNIHIPYSGSSTPSIFLPLTGSNGIRYRLNGVVYETSHIVEPGIIMLIPAGIDLLQFTAPMSGALLVSEPHGKGRVNIT